MLPTAPPPSYRVVPMGDSLGASRALSTPTVSVVELARPRVAWEVGTEWESTEFTDARLTLSLAAAAASGPDVVARLASTFGFASAPVRRDMQRLLQLLLF